MNRRALLTAGVAALASGRASAQGGPALTVLRARYVQGGHVIVRTAPGATLAVESAEVGKASAGGLAVIGFDRDAPSSTRISASLEGATTALPVTIAPGDFDVQRIGGLPANQVQPTDPALLARIAREGELKRAAFASQWDGEGFAGGFEPPVRARVSGRFGGQRVLNGVPARPHYGVDLACPSGTPVLAPAAGLVVLAEPALHYEGGLILIDHGQGLVSAYLHLSKLDAVRGATVAKGQRIGAVGSTGRATGPHLCWRLKWRERNMDPMLLT